VTTLADLRESRQLALLELEALQNRVNDLRDVMVGEARMLNELFPQPKMNSEAADHEAGNE
jgi:hypothetical protein